MAQGASSVATGVLVTAAVGGGGGVGVGVGLGEGTGVGAGAGLGEGAGVGVGPEPSSPPQAVSSKDIASARQEARRIAIAP